MRLAPGGPFINEKSASPEIMEAIEAHYGLNDSLGIQFVNYWGNLLQGDLGLPLNMPDGLSMS